MRSAAAAALRLHWCPDSRAAPPVPFPQLRRPSVIPAKAGIQPLGGVPQGRTSLPRQQSGWRAPSPPPSPPGEGAGPPPPPSFRRKPESSAGAARPGTLEGATTFRGEHQRGRGGAAPTERKIRGRVGGPERRAAPALPGWGCGGPCPPQGGRRKTGRQPPPSLQTQVARTARGEPAELTRRRPRALLPMCRISGSGALCVP